MDFRFDADDLSMIGSLAEAVKARFGLTRFREGRSDRDAIAAMGAEGWLHAGVAEDRGGLGLPLHLVCAFSREAGRALCVEPWVNNAHLLPRLIAASPDPARGRWLDRARANPGFLLADGRRPLQATSSLPEEMTWCFGVEPGMDAYALVGAAGRPALARLDAPEIDLKTVGDLALGVGRVAIGSGAAGADELPLDLDEAGLAAIAAEAMLVHSAALVGLAEKAETITVDYVKIREQFGQAIGKFQAVKHALAEVRVRNEVAANAVFSAALRRGDPLAAGAARLEAVDASLEAARAMVQLHGGIGFTWEADAHWFMKTALTASSRFGSRDSHALALGRALAS